MIESVSIETKTRIDNKRYKKKMVVDTIKKLILYFINSNEPDKIVVETTTEDPTITTETMSTDIVTNDDVQSLYSIVENGLKDNVSIIIITICKNPSMYLFVYKFAMVRNEILHLSILLLLLSSSLFLR